MTSSTQEASAASAAGCKQVAPTHELGTYHTTAWPGGTARSRFRGKGEDAATCTNGDGARYTLAAQGRARRGQSNALLGWAGDPLWQLADILAG
jgi:hypothetical protein